MEKFDIEKVLKNYCEVIRFINFLHEIRKEGGIAKYIELVERTIDVSSDLTHKEVNRQNLKWLKSNREALGACEKQLITGR
jgi:hypothetical protein